MHDFNESLLFSQEASRHPMWKEVYASFFGDEYAGMALLEAAGDMQRKGVDRLVMLANSSCVKVDEKVRAKDYGDILIEYWSAWESRTPGWGAKPLEADYIAYAVLPSQTCYMLPVKTLQAAVVTHGRDWQRRFGWTPARNNRGYTTHSVCVPVDMLFEAMKDASIVRWAQ